MNDVIVIASFTGRLGLLDAYQQQLSTAQVDFHFEQIDRATSSFDMASRLDYWRRIARKFLDYKTVIITDAWDVMFVGTKERLLINLASTAPLNVLISAERNCFPGPEFGYDDLTNAIINPSPWRYANPGMVAANPAKLLEWIEKAEQTKDLNISDQAWCNRRLADGTVLVPLDRFTNVFYVISYNDGRLEDGSLQNSGGYLSNRVYDTYPSFFHFAGHGPGEALRVLPFHKDQPRYETMRIIREYIASK
jgi:hypothetical protein